MVQNRRDSRLLLKRNGAEKMNLKAFTTEFELSDEVVRKFYELLDFTKNNLKTKGDPKDHVLDGAEPLVHELAELISKCPPLILKADHKKEYLEADLSPELIYLDLLLKVANAPMSHLAKASIKFLVPIIDDKLRERETRNEHS